MTLKQTIINDAGTVFLNTDDFAEMVSYVKRGAASGRSIKAVVIREEIASSEESGGAVTPVFEVHVANNSTAGIASTEINLGGDAIEIPVRDGLTASSRHINAILFQDEGMLVLQCL
jgi:hypothetical protein